MKMRSCFHIRAGDQERGKMRMFEDYGDMLTVDEVTDILRIGKNAAYDLFRTGKIKTLRVKRRWMIPKKALIEYVETESKLR